MVTKVSKHMLEDEIELSSIARGLNVPDSQVGFADVGATVKEYLHDKTTQKTYAVPIEAQGQTIVSVVEDVLEASGGTYELGSADQIVGKHGLQQGHFSNYFMFKQLVQNADGGSRLYAMPTVDHVTEGVGGTLKIFGDDFSNNQDYRDCGWYFHANQYNAQSGTDDTGTYGTGVFWLNSKVGPNTGSLYGNQNPDIGFSFNDGQVVCGRITRFGNNNFHWVFGNEPRQVANQTSQVIAEYQGDVAFLKGKKIRWENVANGNLDSYIECGDTLDEFKLVLRGTTVMVWNRSIGIDYSKGVGPSPQPVAKVSTPTGQQVNAGNASLATVLAGETISTILYGVDAQEITILASGAGVIIDSGTDNIRLKGDANATLNLYDTITLINNSGLWVEKCRSIV